MDNNTQAVMWICIGFVIIAALVLIYYMWQPAAPPLNLGLGPVKTKVVSGGDKVVPQPLCLNYGDTLSLADFLFDEEYAWCNGAIPSSMRYGYGAILTGTMGGMALTIEGCGKGAQVYFAPFDPQNPYQGWYLYYDTAQKQGALVCTACKNDGTTASEKYGRGGTLQREDEGWGLTDNTGITFIEYGTKGACYGGTVPHIRIDDQSRISDWNTGAYLVVLGDMTAGITNNAKEADSFGISLCAQI